MKRRQFVAGTATAITVSLAGCGTQSNGPEGVAKGYLNAWVNGNVDKQNKLAHDNGNVPPENKNALELTVDTVSEKPVKDVADKKDSDEASIEESAEDTADEVDADDWTYVFYRLIPKVGEDNEGYMFLVKDGDWLVYRFSVSDENTNSGANSGDDSQTPYTAQNGLAYHDGDVYVVSDREILKIDRDTDDVVTRFSAPGDSRPTGLAYGSESLWFADAVGPDYDGKIAELNPDTGDVRSSITSSWDPRGLAFGDGSLWAVDLTTNSIVEFSPDGDRLSSFDTSDVTWGQGLAYFDGSLWLGNNCSGEGCTVSLREYDTDGNLVQRTEDRSSSSTAPYTGLAATETELLGPGTDGKVTVLRTL